MVYFHLTPGGTLSPTADTLSFRCSHLHVLILSAKNAMSNPEDHPRNVLKNRSTLPLNVGQRTLPLTGVVPSLPSNCFRNHFLN